MYVTHTTQILHSHHLFFAVADLFLQMLFRVIIGPVVANFFIPQVSVRFSCLLSYAMHIFTMLSNLQISIQLRFLRSSSRSFECFLLRMATNNFHPYQLSFVRHLLVYNFFFSDAVEVTVYSIWMG